MPQTTGQMTAKHSTLEVSTDNVIWTDISCSASAFEPNPGGHMTGSGHVFCAPLPLVGIGNIEPTEATVKIMYTEDESEAADLIEGFFTNQTFVYLRWRPAGAGAGNWEWSGGGYFTGPPIPAGDSDSGDLLTVEVPFFGAGLTRAAQAT